MGKVRLKKQQKKPDAKLLAIVFFLGVMGLIAVADASAPQALNVFSDKFYFVKQQAVWFVVGVIALFVVSKVHYSFWEKIALPLFIFSLILLLAVLFPQIGSKALGARRWIFIGPVSIQPSEVVKLALVVYLAKVAAKNKGLMSFFLPLGLVAFLVMLQPDLGTTMVISVAAMAQIFVSGINVFKFLLAVLGGGALSFLAIILSPYRKERLLTFLMQSQDPLGRDYHIRQILLALGSGGIFGVGLGQSRQKYLFLPEAATDSIFAIIAEEVGFVGSVVLIGIFAVFVYRGLKIANAAPDTFSRILSLGIVAWIGGQIFFNISSMVALTPLTGVPLPFFSYGGSSLVMVLTATGILLNVSRHLTNEK